MVERLVARQREHFLSGATRAVEVRRERLARLAAGIDAAEDALLEALEADLGKDRYEAYGSEIAFVLGEIGHARRRLRRWMRPTRRRVPLMAWPGRAVVSREPFGVSLVLGPWNYPFQLSLSPVVASLGAGNNVVLKMSEHAPRTAEAVRAIAAEHFSEDEFAVVTGGADTAQALLAQHFDHVFFTGGTEIGRKVMEAAARNLTPVTLELGGKCPAIVDAGRETPSPRWLEIAARRIVWGKFMNSGQTCVAPDHVWVRREIHDALVQALVQAVAELFPDGCSGLVNQRHFERVRGLLADGKAACGGTGDAATRRIAPTILTDVQLDAPSMREEIFGPVLPVIAYHDLAEPLRRLAEAGAPLAVYLFTGDREVRERVERETRSGGVCINDVVLQIIGKDLPFGGIGASGMGRYHGRAGFDALTWERVILRRPIRPDLPFRYRPRMLDFETFRSVMRRISGA